MSSKFWEDDAIPVQPQKSSFWEDDAIPVATSAPSPAPASPQVSQLESGLRGLAQGATMGFSDELTAGGEHLLTGKPYEQALAESRANYAAAKESNPKTYLASEVGGGLAASFATGLGEAGLVKSAAQGALSGLGYSTAETSGDRLKDVALGAGLGAGAEIAPSLAKTAFNGAIGGLKKGLPALAESKVALGIPHVVAKTAEGVYEGIKPAIQPVVDRLSSVVQSAPEKLGKFAQPLMNAFSKGGNKSLAVTNYILSQQSPEYRETLKRLDQSSDRGQ